MPESVRPGRNEPCHCGSGKKYKQCCLEKDEGEAREARAAARSAAPEAPAGEATERHREPPPQQQRAGTSQPWKRGQNVRGVPRFNAPRKVGGS